MFIQNLGGDNKEYYGILKQAYSRAKWRGGGGVRRNVLRCFKIAQRYSVNKINPFHSLFVGYPQEQFNIVRHFFSATDRQ